MVLGSEEGRPEAGARATEPAAKSVRGQEAGEGKGEGLDESG